MSQLAGRRDEDQQPGAGSQEYSSSVNGLTATLVPFPLSVTGPRMRSVRRLRAKSNCCSNGTKRAGATRLRIPASGAAVLVRDTRTRATHGTVVD